MATKKVVKLEPKHPSMDSMSSPESEERRPQEQEPVRATAEAARMAVKQVILQSATEMAKELITKSGGNYLAVKFLFEFAGLIGESTQTANEPSPLLRYYLEGIRNTRHATSEANKGAKSESV